MKTLFVFLDESGNMDFSSRGTRHFVLAAVTALHPLESSRSLQELKYELLCDGIDLQHFHASEDKQAVRSRVFELLDSLEDIHVNFIFADKHKTHPDYQSTAQFYGLLGKTLLRYICSGYVASQYDQIIIIFDKAFPKKDQRPFLQNLKKELKQLNKPFQVYFHQTLSDFNGQIADYLAWARFVELERNEARPLASIPNVIKTDFDIFKKGAIKYY